MESYHMHISAFQLLSRNEQIEEIYNNGIYIGKLISKFQSHKMVFYQLNDFYIRISYESYRKKIGRIMVSDDVFFIEQLLPSISIEEILNFITTSKKVN